jgi:hypothetical protein
MKAALEKRADRIAWLRLDSRRRLELEVGRLLDLWNRLGDRLA